MSQTHYLGLDKNDVLFVNGSNGFDEMYLFDGEDLKRMAVDEKPHHKKVNQNNSSMNSYNSKDGKISIVISKQGASVHIMREDRLELYFIPETKDNEEIESAVKIDEDGVHVAGKKLSLEGNLILRKEKAQKITKGTLDVDDINIANLKAESANGTAELALATANKALEEIQLAVSQIEFSIMEQTINGIQTQTNRSEEKNN